MCGLWHENEWNALDLTCCMWLLCFKLFWCGSTVLLKCLVLTDIVVSAITHCRVRVRALYKEYFPCQLNISFKSRKIWSSSTLALECLLTQSQLSQIITWLLPQECDLFKVILAFLDWLENLNTYYFSKGQKIRHSNSLCLSITLLWCPGHIMTAMCSWNQDSLSQWLTC